VGEAGEAGAQRLKKDHEEVRQGLMRMVKRNVARGLRRGERKSSSDEGAEEAAGRWRGGQLSRAWNK
jgi:hypothetical protein